MIFQASNNSKLSIASNLFCSLMRECVINFYSWSQTYGRETVQMNTYLQWIVIWRSSFNGIESRTRRNHKRKNEICIGGILSWLITFLYWRYISYDWRNFNHRIEQTSSIFFRSTMYVHFSNVYWIRIVIHRSSKNIWSMEPLLFF